MTPDVLAAIDENAIACQELVQFLNGRLGTREELAQLRNKGLWQITRLAANARITRGEASSTQQFDKIVDLLTFEKRVEENRDCAEIHGHGTDSQHSETKFGPVRSR